MNHPVSERGYFDYHYIGTQEMEGALPTDPDPDDPDAVLPPIRIQYVICDGQDGTIVERIPCWRSRRHQARVAFNRLMFHIMARR